MGDMALEQFLTQLAYQAPQILVYLVGIVLGLLFVRRFGAAAVLCLIGCGLLIAVAVAAAAAQGMILERRLEEGMPHARISRLLMIVGIISSVLRALGLGMIVSAVFLGRRATKQEGGPDPLGSLPAFPDPSRHP